MIVRRWWAAWLPSVAEEQRRIRGGWYPKDPQQPPPPPPPPPPIVNHDRLDRLEQRVKALEESSNG
jgi:hypothetical protein